MNKSIHTAGMVGTRPQTDYNADGVVNSTDYIAWRGAYGRIAYPYADGNKNNVVDAGDYVLWRKSYVPGAGTEVGSVPEPTSLCLLTIAAVFIVCRRALCLYHSERRINAAAVESFGHLDSLRITFQDS